MESERKAAKSLKPGWQEFVDEIFCRRGVSSCLRNYHMSKRGGASCHSPVPFSRQAAQQEKIVGAAGAAAPKQRVMTMPRWASTSHANPNAEDC